MKAEDEDAGKRREKTSGGQAAGMFEGVGKLSRVQVPGEGGTKMANMVSRHWPVLIPLDTVKAGTIAEKQERNKIRHGLARALPVVGAWVHFE
jgi:hypothetical protein